MTEIWMRWGFHICSYRFNFVSVVPRETISHRDCDCWESSRSTASTYRWAVFGCKCQLAFILCWWFNNDLWWVRSSRLTDRRRCCRDSLIFLWRCWCGWRRWGLQRWRFFSGKGALSRVKYGQVSDSLGCDEKYMPLYTRWDEGSKIR